MSRPEHPIFRGPVPVPFDVVEAPTPAKYANWTLEALPPTLPTLAVLARPSGPDVEEPDPALAPVPGLVTSGDGFEDTPDAEAIAGGIHSKGPGYLAIARQGHLLQWGFAGTPDEMTDAGRAIFLNAIRHVVNHAGEPVLGFRERDSRDSVATSLALLDAISPDEREAFLQRLFGNEIPAEARQDREARKWWFDKARPYLYQAGSAQGPFVVDHDARQVGLANHDPALLARCVADLEADAEPTITTERARRLLERYTGQTFADAEGWREWLDAREGRLAFSDVSGYRFLSLDDTRVTPRPGKAPSSADVVTFATSGWANEEEVSVRLSVRVAPGFHLYTPNSKEASVRKLGVSLSPDARVAWKEVPRLPCPPGGHVSGHFVVTLDLRGRGKDFDLLADYQACTEQSCLPPVAGERVAVSLGGS